MVESQEIDIHPQSNHPSSVHEGGLGGIPVVDDRTPGQDLRLIRRAVRNDWPITEEMRELILKRMRRVMKESPDPQVQVAAAKVVISADEVNVKRETLDVRDEHKRFPNLHLHQHSAQTAQVVIMLPHNGRDPIPPEVMVCSPEV